MIAFGVWLCNLKVSAEILDINMLETIAGKVLYEYQHVWKHKRILNHLILVLEGQFTLVPVRLWLNSTLHAFDTWRSTLDYIATVYLQAQQPDKGNSWKHCVSNGATIATNRMSTFLRIQLMIENNTARRKLSMIAHMISCEAAIIQTSSFAFAWAWVSIKGQGKFRGQCSTLASYLRVIKWIEETSKRVQVSYWNLTEKFCSWELNVPHYLWNYLSDRAQVWSHFIGSACRAFLHLHLHESSKF